MDELFLSKIRLAIIAELLTVEWAAFSVLQNSVQSTNGNLGAHLAKLVEAGYVKEVKRFENRRPQSRYRLTKSGRSAFLRHVAELQTLVSGKS
jgi:DNA-binding HxlR family transcriptional regulator